MSTQVTIEFDGGTPCNIPRLGYGIGYGSYRITDSDGKELHRRDRGSFGIPMSNNAAELATLTAAMLWILENTGEDLDIELTVIGDSKIALNWLNMERKAPKPESCSSGLFYFAVLNLREVAAKFTKITPVWKGRAHAVALFGH